MTTPEYAAPVSHGVADPFGIVGTMQSRVFRVEAAVAEGGFGVVYRAYHEAFRSDVALKCLKVPELLTDDQKLALLERFRTEAELLFRLSASMPEIVRPLQFGVLELEDGSPGTPKLGAGAVVPYLALEWLDGLTLDAFVAGRRDQGKAPLTLTRALELLTPVARALARAHDFPQADGSSVAIIHRDMKPENVFLSNIGGEQRPKILDFGIARIRADASAMLGRATGADPLHAFSPAYAAPEQWNPAVYGATGPWTDVYGLALIMTEVLVGRPPIEGNFTVMMGAALNKDWRPTPRNRGAKVTDECERAFERALAVDPKQRTSSIEAFWTQLELSVGRPASVTRRGATNPSMVPSTPPPAFDIGSLELEADIPMNPAGADVGTELDFDAPSSSAGSSPAAPEVKPPSMREVAPASQQTPSLEMSGPASGLSLELATRRPPRPRPGKAADAPAVWQAPPSSVTVGSLGQRFTLPLWLVAIGVAVAVANIVMVRTTGEKLEVGPLSAFWIAGPLTGLGILIGVVRLIQD